MAASEKLRLSMPEISDTSNIYAEELRLSRSAIKTAITQAHEVEIVPLPGTENEFSVYTLWRPPAGLATHPVLCQIARRKGVDRLSYTLRVPLDIDATAAPLVVLEAMVMQYGCPSNIFGHSGKFFLHKKLKILQETGFIFDGEPFIHTHLMKTYDNYGERWVEILIAFALERSTYFAALKRKS